MCCDEPGAVAPYVYLPNRSYSRLTSIRRLNNPIYMVARAENGFYNLDNFMACSLNP